MSEELWGVLTVLEFADGDDVSFNVLGHDLSQKDAQKLADIIPAVANSTGRPAKRAYIRIMEQHLIDELNRLSEAPHAP